MVSCHKLPPILRLRGQRRRFRRKQESSLHFQGQAELECGAHKADAVRVSDIAFRISDTKSEEVSAFAGSLSMHHSQSGYASRAWSPITDLQTGTKALASKTY